MSQMQQIRFPASVCPSVRPSVFRWSLTLTVRSHQSTVIRTYATMGCLCALSQFCVNARLTILIAAINAIETINRSKALLFLHHWILAGSSIRLTENVGLEVTFKLSLLYLKFSGRTRLIQGRFLYRNYTKHRSKD